MWGHLGGRPLGSLWDRFWVKHGYFGVLLGSLRGQTRTKVNSICVGSFRGHLEARQGKRLTQDMWAYVRGHVGVTFGSPSGSLWGLLGVTFGAKLGSRWVHLR